MEGLRHNYVTFLTFKGKNENKKCPPQKRPSEGISRRDIGIYDFLKWTSNCERVKSNKIGKDEQALYLPKKSNQKHVCFKRNSFAMTGTGMT